jgi:hypothetical protein
MSATWMTLHEEWHADHPDEGCGFKTCARGEVLSLADLAPYTEQETTK